MIFLVFSYRIGDIRTTPVNPMTIASSVPKNLNACQLRDEQ
jgi:hypothetical protein